MNNLDTLKNNYKILRTIIEKLFTFGELDSYYDSIEITTHNIFCPFHEYEQLPANERSPAARVKYNEEKDIFIIHCWVTHKNYSVFDYIKNVLQEDPYEYLLKKKEKEKIKILYENLLKGYIEIDNKILEKKIRYINNTAVGCNENTEEYIECLYNPID